MPSFEKWVEKWIDELQIAVDRLTKRVDVIASEASGAFKPDIESPADGQVIIYDGTSE